MRKVNKKKKKNDLVEKLNLNKKKDDTIKSKKSNNSQNKNNIKNKSVKNNVKNKNVKDNKNNIRNKKSENSKNKKPKRSIWKRILTILLIMGIAGVLLVASFFAYIVLSAPKFNEAAFDVKDQTIVYDINGQIIAKLGVQNRESVTYDQLPQVLIDAIIATEDSRFFQHNGVDFGGCLIT